MTSVLAVVEGFASHWRQRCTADAGNLDPLSLTKNATKL